MKSLLSFLSLPFIIILVIIAVILILFLVALLAEILRKLLQKKGLDEEIGEFLFSSGKAESELQIWGSERLRCYFPVDANGKISEPVRLILKAFADPAPELKIELARAAVDDFKQLFEAGLDDSDEDSEFKNCLKMMNELIEVPEKFLEKFSPVCLSIEEDPAEVYFEMLTPWDPEHTVTGIFDYKLNLTGYSLTCAL